MSLGSSYVIRAGANGFKCAQCNIFLFLKNGKKGQNWFACCKTRNLNLFLNSTFKSLNLPRPISKVEKFRRKISPKNPLKIIFWLKSLTKIRIDFFFLPPKIVATYTLCFLQIWFSCCIILNSRLSVGSRIISCLLFCFF